MGSNQKKKVAQIFHGDTDAIIKAAARVGADAAMERMAKEQQKTEAAKRDWRLRNVKLLMSNYRELKAFADNAVYSAVQVEEELDPIWDPRYSAEQIIESVKSNAVRTSIAMAHVETALFLYKKICEASQDESMKRRYGVLHDRYIAEELFSVEDVAAKQNVDARTVYRDTDTAMESLARLLFGIDAIQP